MKTDVRSVLNDYLFLPIPNQPITNQPLTNQPIPNQSIPNQPTTNHQTLNDQKRQIYPAHSLFYGEHARARNRASIW
jgi:hypothetical protein